MAKIIDGTKAAKQQVTVLKAQGGNISKIRCPNCKQMAQPRPDGRGGLIVTCTACNLSFKPVTM